MQVHVRALIGRPVVAADGTHVGRLADLVAEQQGDDLCVVALLVGPAALARRIGHRRSWLFHAAPPRRIAWSLVARVGDHIHLRVTKDDLPPTGDSAAVNDVGPGLDGRP